MDGKGRGAHIILLGSSRERA